MSDASVLHAAALMYARGADRRDKALWRQVLTHDIVITGPGFAIEGLDANLGSIDHLAQAFVSTRHIVHDIDAVIVGDAAEGETRSTAEHRLANDTLLVWAIRYQDQWRCEMGVWRFSRRELVVDWQEVRPLTALGGGA